MIKLKIGEYKKLSLDEAKLFLDMDADGLFKINNGEICYLFTQGLFIESAIVPADFNPANIDVWMQDEIEDCKGIIEILGFSTTLTCPEKTSSGKPYYSLYILGGRKEEYKFIKEINPCIKRA